MKPAFKTTALAILVALGVTACKSNDSSNPAPQPTPVNNQANTGNTQANNATQDAEQARLEAEKKAQEAEQARLDAEKKAKEAADLKAKEEAEKARLEAEKKAQEAEQARLEAEKKAKEAADLKAKQEAEKARLEAEKKAKEAEQARLEAEKKAKEAADLKAKEEAEKARLEAEKKAKEAEQARLEAEKKAKEAAELKAKQEAEKVANEWRTAKATGANVTSPASSLGHSYTSNVNADEYKGVGDRSAYVAGYDGTKEPTPIRNASNRGYKLDYYQLAIEDKANPQVLGWHKGEIKSAGINGSEITKLNVENRIIERSYPEKVNYMFKNTPYATYGAVYNNYESKLFAFYEKASSLGANKATYQVGEYEVIDGNKTTKIKYNDSVKGAATYKGEVIAHIERQVAEKDATVKFVTAIAPEVDGSITINANFGPRAEENFATATLDSKALGKREFPKSKMSLGSNGIHWNSTVGSAWGAPTLSSTVVGKEADEIVGKIEYSADRSWSPGVGKIVTYKAVFAAEKQPK